MRTTVAVVFTLGCTLLSSACSSTLDHESVSIVDPTPDGDKADAANSLSSARSSLVLTLLDDACGDAWCEGDLEWTFKKLVCHFDVGTCTVTVLVTRPASNGVPPASFWRACKMTGLRRFPQLVDTAANGYQSLTDALFTKFDACASKIEASVPTT